MKVTRVVRLLVVLGLLAAACAPDGEPETYAGGIERRVDTLPTPDPEIGSERTTSTTEAAGGEADEEVEPFTGPPRPGGRAAAPSPEQGGAIASLVAPPAAPIGAPPSIDVPSTTIAPSPLPVPTTTPSTESTPSPSPSPTTTAAPSPAPTTTAAPSPSPSPTTTAAPSPAPTTTTTSPPPPPPPPSGSGYGSPRQPFAATSIWNQRLADNTVNGSNDPWNLSGAGLTINRADFYGHPFYQATEADTTYTIRIGNYENWAQSIGGQGFREIQFKMPAGIASSGGTDGHLAIAWGDRLLEMYQASWDGSAWFTPYAVEQSLSGDGRQSGTRAHGNAGIAGLIQGWEVDAGVINHKVNLMIDQPWLTRVNADHYFPATRSDNFGYGNDSRGAHMGEVFRIAADVNIDALGLSAHGLMLARALQDYGGVISDQSGSRSLGATNWDAGHFNPSYQDLETISDLLVRVTSISAGNPTGAR